MSNDFAPGLVSGARGDNLPDEVVKCFYNAAKFCGEKFL